MTERICSNCAYSVVPLPVEGLGEPGAAEAILPVCANHVASPGQVRQVRPDGSCRNFKARRQPVRRVEPPEPSRPGIKHIPLTKGMYAIVDEADYEWLSQYRWYAQGRPGERYAARNNIVDAIAAQ